MRTSVLNRAPHILPTDRETHLATLKGTLQSTFLGNDASTRSTVVPILPVILTVPVLGSTPTPTIVVPPLPTLSLAPHDRVLNDTSVILPRCTTELPGPVCSMTPLNLSIAESCLWVATGAAILILTTGRRFNILVVDLWPRLPRVPRKLPTASLKPVNPLG